MVCWRVENQCTSLGSVSLDFQVDLYCSTPSTQDFPKRFLSDKMDEQNDYSEQVYLLNSSVNSLLVVK